MIYLELQIQLDLNPDNRVNVLNSIDNNIDTCRLTRYGYLFVDSGDGQCYLFDEDGNLDDISKVKNIGNSAFEKCTSLENISIPNSVKSIGGYAFFSCTSLTSIKIPNSVENIGVWVFAYCTSLASIEIPNSVKSIGRWAFYNCASLKELVFEGKTIDQVKAMKNYPWGIKDESAIKYKAFK